MKKLKEIKKLTIVREKWARGSNDNKPSMPRCPDGKMCCLGFALHACGLDYSVLDDEIEPDNVSVGENTIPAFTVFDRGSPRNTELSAYAIRINDSTLIDDITRERQLIALFKDWGIDLNFVNETEKQNTCTQEK